MPRTKSIASPSYRLHKPSGQAVVTICGRDFYLGEFGTESSRAEYDRRIAEWLANGRNLPAADGVDLTVNEVTLRYLQHAATYYRALDGSPTGELDGIKMSVRPLVRLYGGDMASAFTPLKLKAVRQAMIDADLCRNEINKRIGRIVRMFRWCVEMELVRADVHQALRAVESLKRGRSEARDTEPVKPVPDAFVDAVAADVHPTIAAMIQIQRLTGMRPGEVCAMRTIDLDTSGAIWIYRPARHKTAWHGHKREIYLGPRAQGILKEWLKTDMEAPIFSPAEAVKVVAAQRRRGRKSPLTPSQLARQPKANGKRRPAAECYRPHAYANAIRRSCYRLGIPLWHPHQLRHNAGTALRREFGLETAKTVLGHRSMVAAEIYAERDAERALAAVAKTG